MTLGERIQELRKRDGLSQEQLGEKLGVSRQAISKWEGDVTLPEVEKLVALSRLFRANVGVLLGVEEPRSEDESADRGLTERELAAVEAVAARYVPTGQSQRRWPMVVIAAVLTLALGGTLFWVSHLNSALRALDGRVSNDVSQLESRISSALVQQPSIPAATEDDLFATRSCTVETIDPDEDTVTLLLSVTPKRYINGMTAEFTATGQSFSPVATGCTESAGQTFTTRLTCPLDDEITITVALDVDKSGVKDVRPLDTLYNLRRDSTITVSTWWENSKQVAIEVAVGDRATAQPDQVRLLVKKDAVVVNEYRVNLRDQFEPSANGGATAIGPVTYFIYPEESKGEAQFVAYLKDTTGREYEVPLE